MQVWQLAAYFLPAGFVVGVAGAAIGFTAWILVLPLLLVGFDFTVANALFVSLAIDALNGFLLAAFFASRGLCALRPALAMAAIGVPIATVLVVFVSRTLLPKHESLLKGAVPVTALLVAAGFILRGLVLQRKASRAKGGESKAGTPSVLPPGTGLGAGRAVPPGYFSSVQSGGAEAQIDAGAGGESTGLLGGTEAVASPSLQPLRLAVAAVATAVISTVVGLIGIGGGMLFAGAGGYAFRLPLRTSVGSGMLTTGLVLVGVMAGWADRVDGDVVWKPIAAMVIGTVVGLAVGTIAALRVSKITLNFLIGGVLFATGVVVIVQSVILKHETKHSRVRH
ncbi:uncharacterized protein AMSG_01177 [Thecamonas trahens ATCC 50062]|uniref:Membrane transporter protein n=1 Tax=Thecamonas trahens ATCC 50062 TaxID=461836 RepID=A0A0L0DMB6_THETB|nr:hypothetical protein AMSG_01177 [Thecamonas trahens ATCC 50062]KNC53464.1 hypothetical protein AMSG_01177 [Thecamonas trahens ATCC 50062]|eukprot:XP_013761788.1 hypothetical protein AMSG_01177 [Thecamonas trahens ATCC 50062]